jgi:hypothetical protein
MMELSPLTRNCAKGIRAGLNERSLAGDDFTPEFDRRIQGKESHPGSAGTGLYARMLSSGCPTS